MRRWLVDAVEEADDALSAVLGSLGDLAPVTDPATAAQAAVCARDAVRLADGLGIVGRVVEVGKFAARAADAGAEREWIEAARAGRRWRSARDLATVTDEVPGAV